MLIVTILATLGLVGFETCGHDNRPHIDCEGLLLILWRQNVTVDPHTTIYIVGPINGRRRWVTTVLGLINRLAPGETEIKIVGHLNVASGNRRMGDVVTLASRLAADLDLKVAHVPADIH